MDLIGEEPDHASDAPAELEPAGLGDRLAAHEAHHATELHDLLSATRDVLEELAAGVGSDDLPWAVRGVRQLRAHLRRLDARLERLEGAVPTGPAGSVAPAPGAAGGSDPAVGVSGLFDYAGFERQFRGSPQDIERGQIERYGELLLGTTAGRIVDVGCGRGEFAHYLASQGRDVVGVEPDEGMSAHAEALGVSVARATAADYLQTVDDGSLGAVISFQLVEHLPFDALLELVDLSARKLRPGGLFLAETPNPASWVVMHSSFILDPTHRLPLHPGLLSFVCASSGLEGVEVQYFAEASNLHLPQVHSEADPALAEQVNTAFAQLNHHLYGPQDYAVVARKP